MRLVTFTCELNYRDYFINSMKAGILSLVPDANFLDISRQIAPFETIQAALILKNSFELLPKGSIHFVFVQNIIDTKTPPIVFKYKEHFFVTADNGFISLFLQDEKAENVVQLNAEIFATPFSEITYYPTLVKELFNGSSVETLGISEDFEFKEFRFPRPFFEEKALKGMILYFDLYDNAITNIKKQDFEKYSQFRNFELTVQYVDFTLKRINNFYHEVYSGEVFALFNQFDLLEIGQYNGKIKELYNLKNQTRVSIEFND